MSINQTCDSNITCQEFAKQFDMTAEIIDKPVTAKISDSLSTGKIIDTIIITIGDGGSGGDDEAVVIPFTSSDLVAGKLIKLHGKNRKVVDVTVVNPTGLEFSPRVNNLNDNTRVEVDLTRYEITGTWYLMIE